MVRYFDDPTEKKVRQCRKSQIRHELERLFPNGFQWGHKRDQDWIASGTTDIICIDMLRYIKLIRPGVSTTDTIGRGEEYNTEYDEEASNMKTYDEAVKYLTSVITRSIEQSKSIESENGPLVVIVGVDKYEYVCPARSIVHHNRAKARNKEGDDTTESNGKEEEEVETDKPFMIPSLSDTITQPFIDITADKVRDSRVLFKFLTTHIIKELKERRFMREILIVFEGHCVDKATIMGYELNSLLGPPVTMYSTPICLSVSATHKSRLIWMKVFENENGETDFVSFFYMKHAKLFEPFFLNSNARELWKNKEHFTMDLYTVDTDGILYSLIYLDMRKELTNHGETINMMYTGISKKQNLPDFEERRKYTKWCFVNTLLGDITEAISTMSKYIKYPGLQVAMAGLAGGSDYTEAHEQTPHHHFVNAFVTYPDVIENLVKVKMEEENFFYNLVLDSKAYIRFICLTHITAKKTTNLWKTYKPDDPTEPDEPVSYKFVHQRLVQNYQDSDKYWLPSPKDLVYQAKQLQYYLNMVSRLGEARVDIELQDSDLAIYGYGKLRIDDQDKYYRKVHRYTKDEIEEQVELNCIKRKKKKEPKKKESKKDKKEKKPAKKQKKKPKLEHVNPGHFNCF